MRVVIVEGEGAGLGMNFGASHCNQWELCCVIVGELRALPKLLQGRLVLVVVIH